MTNAAYQMNYARLQITADSYLLKYFSREKGFTTPQQVQSMHY